MPIRTNNITPAIIESLYGEALALAEEARTAFELSVAMKDEGEAAARLASGARIALSCEALRTTTRMMHALAWLLNHRAYFAGELSEFQLRRHGRLPGAQPPSDPAQLAQLDPAATQVVARTCTFYARVERLDRNWRIPGTEFSRPVQQLRARIGRTFAIN